MLQKEDSFSPKDIKLWLLVTLLGVLGALGVVYFRGELRSQFPSEPTPPIENAPSPQPTAVAALGRLEPEGEVTTLSAPSSLDGTTTRVEQLLIQEGDWLTAGQVVAVLDVYSRRRAALVQAEAAELVAAAELARVEAGAKTGDISAQQANVARLEAEVANARQEYQRFEALHRAGAISESELDTKRLVLDTTEAQLAQARSSLDSVAEVRPEDVQVARAELNRATSAVQQAQAELDVTYIRAPLAGQVLNIHTKPGEVIGNQGVLDIGQTRQMYVVAEVYETDIPKVEIGQSATITSAVTSGELRGEVMQIGLEVSPQGIFTADPTVNTDNKVVKVRIRLNEESSRQVSGLSNLQVQVVIQV